MFRLVLTRANEKIEVKLGADSFLACHEGQFEIVHRGLQLAVRKTAY